MKPFTSASNDRARWSLDNQHETLKVSAWQAWHLRHWAGSGGALGSQWTLATSTCILPGTRGTWRHRRAFCVAGLALGGIDVHSAWQAWHLRDWAGSGGALGSQWTPLSPQLFAWQAWHLAASTCILRGRRGTYGTGLALVARLVPSGRRCRRGCLRGRRGPWRRQRAFCLARVALGDIDVHSAWQAWHLAASTCILRGRRGTYGTGLALVARLVPSGRRCRRDCLRGRRGTWRHRPPLCVASVALGDIDVHSAWQAWHLAISTSTLRGRRGTWRHRRAFCVQPWCLVTSTFTLRGRCGTYCTSLALVAFVTHTHHFVTHNSHTTLLHIARFFTFTRIFVTHTHNFVTQNSSTQLCHRFLSHTTLSHKPFTHTTLSHTQLSHTHTTFSHTTLSHITLSHTSLSHTQSFTQLCHIQLFHTQHFYIYKLTHTHSTVTHSSFTQPVLHHLLSFLPFPSHFHLCLVLIGRSWFVGLSGPFIIIIIITIIIFIIIIIKINFNNIDPGKPAAEVSQE